MLFLARFAATCETSVLTVTNTRARCLTEFDYTHRQLFPNPEDAMATYPGGIVITGASGGIGSQLTDYLIRNGTRNLVCQYRSDPTALLSILSQHGMDPEKHAFKADLTDEEQVRALAAFAHKNLGTIWGIVNLAGASENGLSWKLSKDAFTRIIEANLVTTFLVCREFIPSMRTTEGGRIINVSSVIAFTGVVGASHYCAAKAGIAGFTKAIALELAGKNITANTLALGYFKYGLIEDVPADMLTQIVARVPVKRLGAIEEIGGIVRYLLDESSGFTTGQVMHVNGGLY